MTRLNYQVLSEWKLNTNNISILCILVCSIYLLLSCPSKMSSSLRYVIETWQIQQKEDVIGYNEIYSEPHVPIVFKF